jgi:hypothetical protein
MTARIKAWTIAYRLRCTIAVDPIVRFSSLFLAIRGLDNGGNYTDRTTLHRQLRAQQHHTDRLLADASLLNVMDSFPIELLFPIRQGRSKQQLGKKSRDKGRWSIGIRSGGCRTLTLML